MAEVMLGVSLTANVVLMVLLGLTCYFGNRMAEACSASIAEKERQIEQLMEELEDED